jgi:alpha-L-rhamnosidase
MSATSGVVVAAWLICFAFRVEPVEAAPPDYLRCEYRVAPMGIDAPRPRLSWRIRDGRRGAVQTARQIIVYLNESGTPGERVWNSGKVFSDRSIHVPYAGPPLLSGRGYLWHVQTWDAQDRPSGFSEYSNWEMGLLSPSDWSARWISWNPPDSKRPEWGNWIWSPGGAGERATHFRRTFELDDASKVSSALIWITSDDHYVLHVNGREMGRNHRWDLIHQYEMRDQLRSGRNVIAVEGSNAQGAAGLLVTAQLAGMNGQIRHIPSDAEWRTSATAPHGWTLPEFKDTGWASAAVIAPYGAEPWKRPHRVCGERRSMCLRRSFRVDRHVKRARIYATGLGLYVLTLDGKPVSRSAMAPDWTDYSRRVNYQTFDITDRLQPGEHVLGAMLGNGWWAMGLGWASNVKGVPEEPRFILQLEIEYSDGTRQRLVTDREWRAHPSPVTRNSIYHGEEYDGAGSIFRAGIGPASTIHRGCRFSSWMIRLICWPPSRASRSKLRRNCTPGVFVNSMADPPFSISARTSPAGFA